MTQMTEVDKSGMTEAQRFWVTWKRPGKSQLDIYDVDSKMCGELTTIVLNISELETRIHAFILDTLSQSPNMSPYFSSAAFEASSESLLPLSSPPGIPTVIK